VPAARILALALAFATLGAAGAELGTLFHTPQERERLDRLRRGEPDRDVSVPRAGAPSVTGFVKRSDGRGTVWIDGTALPVSPETARKLDPAAVRAYSQDNDERLRIERKAPR
jgi:hypothetical protein